MSVLYWNTEHGDAELRGGEFHHLRLCSHIAIGVLHLEDSKDAIRKLTDPGHSMARFRDGTGFLAWKSMAECYLHLGEDCLQAMPGYRQFDPCDWAGYRVGRGLSYLDLTVADWENRVAAAFTSEPGMVRERKSVVVRVDPAVHDALARWAADELRSTTAQIEFLLRRAITGAGRLPAQATGPVPSGPVHDGAGGGDDRDPDFGAEDRRVP